MNVYLFNICVILDVGYTDTC